jgi:hypothetical protein
MLCCVPYAYGRILLQYSLCAFSFLSNIMVASCWLSSGVVQLSVLLLLHARTHLTKKKIAPVFRVVVVTRRFVTSFLKFNNLDVIFVEIIFDQ